MQGEGASEGRDFDQSQGFRGGGTSTGQLLQLTETERDAATEQKYAPAPNALWALAPLRGPMGAQNHVCGQRPHRAPPTTRPSATPGKTTPHIAALHRQPGTTALPPHGGRQTRPNRHTTTPLGANPILEQTSRRSREDSTAIQTPIGLRAPTRNTHRPPYSRRRPGERHTYRAPCAGKSLSVRRLAHDNQAWAPKLVKGALL